MTMKVICFFAFLTLPVAAQADEKRVYLEDQKGARLEIAVLNIAENGSYSVTMSADNFSEYFLSMRPFRCLEGPKHHWCHVPYPYAIARNVSVDLVDLEYDFLFVWKGASEYGINLWNGVYYRLSDADGKIVGQLYEVDIKLLAVPPAKGDMRPIRAKDLHASDPGSHWLPVMVIE